MGDTKYLTLLSSCVSVCNFYFLEIECASDRETDAIGALPSADCGDDRDADYFDKLVLLCTASSLESPQTRRYMAELAGGKGLESRWNITSLAADTLFDHSQDALCAQLKEGTGVDFRGWEDDGVFETALASLITVLSGAAP